MSKWAIPIGVGVGLGLYMFKDRLFGAGRPPGGAGSVTLNTTQSTPAAFTPIMTPPSLAVRAFLPGQLKPPVPTAPPPPGTSPGGGSIGGGPSAQDIGAGIGAVAAAAGCTSLGGVGALAAPLCAQAGSVVGGAAVKYGTAAGKAIGSAAKDVGSWVSGLF